MGKAYAFALISQLLAIRSIMSPKPGPSIDQCSPEIADNEYSHNSVSNGASISMQQVSTARDGGCVRSTHD